MIKEPKIIKEHFNLALKKYPELKDKKIFLVFKKSSLLMKSLPKWNFLFKKRINREYIIIISKKYNKFLKELTKKEIIAWFSHELGHIKQYSNMNSLKLIKFGIKYIIIKNIIKKVERSVDKLVIKKGMERELLGGIKKALKSRHIPQNYKQKIKRYYSYD